MKNTFNGASFHPQKGDFIATAQGGSDIVVWNVSGQMCITSSDGPIYITKEQAKKFFNLTEAAGE